MRRNIASAAALLFALLFAVPLSAGETGEPSIRQIGRGDITVELSSKPEKVSLADDFDITIEIISPEKTDTAVQQNFSDRFEGFVIDGSYEGEPFVTDGKLHRTIHIKAKPIPGAVRYRLAPFAVRTKTGNFNDTGSWFPTKAVIFEAASVIKEGETKPDGITESLSIIKTHPSFRYFAKAAGAVAAAAVALAAIIMLFKSIRHRIKIYRMNPRDRALLELDQLLKKALPEKGRTKQFYVELTGIVRHYIERRHGIKAPEQTTDEFLQEAMRHPAFPKETLSGLREFLDAADLVKFAGVEVSEETVGGSVKTAKSYLENEPTEKEARK